MFYGEILAGFVGFEFKGKFVDVYEVKKISTKREDIWSYGKMTMFGWDNGDAKGRVKENSLDWSNKANGVKWELVFPGSTERFGQSSNFREYEIMISNNGSVK